MGELNHFLCHSVVLDITPGVVLLLIKGKLVKAGSHVCSFWQLAVGYDNI